MYYDCTSYNDVHVLWLYFIAALTCVHVAVLHHLLYTAQPLDSQQGLGRDEGPQAPSTAYTDERNLHSSMKVPCMRHSWAQRGLSFG